MSAGIWFWIIYVICALFGGWLSFPFERKSGVWLVVMILIGLLGWGIFGPPIR
jgi:hypothetical protein